VTESPSTLAPQSHGDIARLTGFTDRNGVGRIGTLESGLLAPRLSGQFHQHVAVAVARNGHALA